MRYLERLTSASVGALGLTGVCGNMQIYCHRLWPGDHNGHSGRFLTDGGAKRYIGRPVSDGCSERCGDCGREDTMVRGP